MIVVAADETEGESTAPAHDPLRAAVRASHDDLAVGAGTEAQLRVRLDKVAERKLLVLFAQHGSRDQVEHHVLGRSHVTLAGHAADAGGGALPDLALEVHRPAVAAKGVATAQVVEAMRVVRGVAHGAGCVGGCGALVLVVMVVRGTGATTAASVVDSTYICGWLDASGHEQTGRIAAILRDNVGDVPLVFVQQNFGQRRNQLQVVAQLFDALVEQLLDGLQVQAAVLKVFGVLLQIVGGRCDEVVKAFCKTTTVIESGLSGGGFDVI